MLRTNHETCLHALVEASKVKDAEAEKFARVAERFAFRACMLAMSDYDVDVESSLGVALDNLKNCVNILNSNYNISVDYLLENFQIKDK